MRLTIDFLDGTDENVTQLISCLQFGLSVAVEGELVSPDFETDVRGWMRAERARMRPQLVGAIERETLRESRWFEFWSTLEPGQEVRWTKTVAATYFVVTGELVSDLPEGQRAGGFGPFVELRRHTGKTFWSHVAQVRPPDWRRDA